MNNNFPIRMRVEVVAALHQPGAQLAVVVDLAVENERDFSGFIRQRLVAGLKVNDAQPANRQGDMWQLKLAFAVRPAVPDPG